MKYRFVCTALFVLTLILSVAALAKEKSATIDIYQPAQISGATLQPGTYKVTVNESGSTAAVSFLRNGKQVATATGQVVQLPRKPANTAVTVNTSGGAAAIAEIDFEGSQSAVRFGGQANTAGSGE